MNVSLTPHQKKFIAKKMENGGYLSRSEVVREALRAYELSEQDGDDPELESALRHALRGPRRKYTAGHFAALASRNGRSQTAE
jgi:putative addiction module CopG family antidote